MQYNLATFQLLIEQASDIITVLDVDGVIQYESPSFEHITGHKSEEVIGKNVFDYIHHDDSSKVKNAIGEALQNIGETKSVDFRFLNQDGSWRSLESVGRIVLDEENTPLIIVNSRDISDRVKIQETLNKTHRALSVLNECNTKVIRIEEESELLQEMCRLIVEVGSYRLAWIGFVEHDEAKSVKPVAQKGYEEGYLETVNITWADTERGHGPTGTSIRTHMPSVCQNILTDIDYAPWRKQAIEHGYESSISLPLIIEKQVIGVLCIYASEPHAFNPEELGLLIKLADNLAFGIASLRSRIMREQTENELRESETRYSSIVNLAHDAVISVDEEQNITLFNKAAEDIFGYSQKEVLGKKLGQLMPQKYRSSHDQYASDFLHENLRTAYRHARSGILGERKNGEEFPAEVSLSSYEKDGKRVSTVILRDISERKLMEEQLLQSQKMEAVGTLVGGIAHDFNNMLSGIMGNLYLAKLDVKGKATVMEALDKVETLSTRAADMIKQLLTFARKGEISMSVFSLNPFLKEALKLAGSGVPENINLNYQMCPDDLIIRGDATQLQQVIMNLLNNARDAVADVSEPAIDCMLDVYSATDKFRQRHPDLAEGRFARLTVRDNGCGIPEAKLNQIFDPFFTTKGVGAGTGLGLAMAFGSVQSHGGAIEVESEAGQGTSFHIYLPLQEQVEKVEVEKATVAVKGHGEMILLVDDEESMRSTMAKVLNSLDYKVLEAGDGEEALEMFRAHQDDIDLILTDIVMPKMGGVDLAKSIRLFDKNVPIIFATGYDKEQAMSSDDQVDQSIIVNKPLLIVELSQLIRRMIEPH